MTEESMIPEDQDNWLHKVAREWRGPDNVRLMEMETGIVRLCIGDSCYASEPGGLDAEELATSLNRLGMLYGQETEPEESAE